VTRTVHDATVIARRQLTASTLRLTLSAPDVCALVQRPAHDLEVLLADRDGQRVKRRYTIRQTRPDTGELDLDVVLHEGGGPGAAWATTAPVGSHVNLIGPRGKLELRPAGWYLFVGDETSLPAIAALTEALGPTACTVVLAEVAGPQDQIRLTAALDVRWLHRDRSPAGDPELLSEAIAALTAPADHGRAYLLGESRVVRELSQQLGHLAIASQRAFVKGYWNRRT